MIPKEQLLSMVPRISVEYVNNNRQYLQGTFDSIPKDISLACISAFLPITVSDGKLKLKRKSCNLVVGQKVVIDELLKKDLKNEIRNLLQQYKNNGYSDVAISHSGVYPLGYNDAVFSSVEDLKNALTKIVEDFDSLDINKVQKAKK